MWLQKVLIYSKIGQLTRNLWQTSVHSVKKVQKSLENILTLFVLPSSTLVEVVVYILISNGHEFLTDLA